MTKLALKDSLGERMKRYETSAKRTFIQRMPLIIRLDGRHFHSFLKPIKKQNPFHPDMENLMNVTLTYLCENIQNVKFGFTQSDEISLLLTDWDTFETQQWFSGTQSKIESIAASMATAVFNHYRRSGNLLKESPHSFAMFDARAFNLPKEDVTNYFIWRQKDVIRNSVSMLAQHSFSHTKLQGKSCTEMKEMLLSEKNINWDLVPRNSRYGTCLSKSEMGWIQPEQTPDFVENRDFIETLLQ